MVVLEVDGIRVSLEKDGRRRFFGKVEIPQQELQRSLKVVDKKHFTLYFSPKKPMTSDFVIQFEQRYQMRGGLYDTRNDVIIHCEDENGKVELVLKPKMYVSPAVRKFNNKKKYSISTVVPVPKEPRSSPPKHPQYVNTNIRRPYQAGAVSPR